MPEEIEPERLSKILTSIGLEVESLERFESIKGSLSGIVIGKVLETSQHPNADKLKLTKVDTGAPEPLKIVCGAANVAAGQKVLVARVGSTIYPVSGEPVTIKAAKIRGEESQGMICAEDEIGLGTSHEGILVLPEDAVAGTKAADYFQPYTDWVYEIGLTPNRMDAMSHFGVAKDVCAYLSHHEKKEIRPKSPFPTHFEPDNDSLRVQVQVENTDDCPRYSGITISGVSVKESPQWLKDKLTAIGQRPINNIVDITNYILNETGQPLHAFDTAAIKGNTIVVKNLPQNSTFITLDEKERKLASDDLMICNAEEGMCIAGVFGGAKSGVKPGTKSIFLESAWFNPVTIRKTSFRHGLRTEAAARFEKGVDISNVVNVLKRAALLIKEVAGGTISSDVIDIYPNPAVKTEVTLTYNYLKKLSGNYYPSGAVKGILISLGFEIISEGADEIHISVPFSKPDVSLPADIVEEVLRIDGLDNVPLKATMTIAPSHDPYTMKEHLKEKIAGYLTGAGFYEIVTNSITNSAYYDDDQLSEAVKMINSLSADLDVMRPSMVESGLEAIAYNVNRKNRDLQFFQLGKSYHSSQVGNYEEKEHLALYMTGQLQPQSWKSKQTDIDFYRAKGLANAIVQLCGLSRVQFSPVSVPGFSIALIGLVKDHPLVTIAEVSPENLRKFDIKQPVFYIDFDWLLLLQLIASQKITYREVSKFPVVNRDLAIVIDNNIAFEAVESCINTASVSAMLDVKLFDIFESEKLGAGKKSMAVSFTFGDEEKTLTDKEIDGMMNRLIRIFETKLNAEIRK